MGYSGNLSTGDLESLETSSTFAILAFLAISLYNVIELNVIILTVFKHRKGLYFWSFVAATNGIAPHSVGFLLKNVVFSDNFGLYVTLIAVGWTPMVTGQSLVLYSRLHLILFNRLCLRFVLAMIIINAIVLQVPIITLMYGANSSNLNDWVPPYIIYEKIQVTVFFLQEVIISGIYIKTCFSFFKVKDSPHGDAIRKMRRHLILVNVFIILLDIPIICLQYTGFYDLQTAYKAFVYSVKLKMEFQILNKLVEMTQVGRDGRSGRLFQDDANIRVQNSAADS